MKLKHGQLVVIRERRRERTWVALNVTKKDIARGVQVYTPGIHLFTGYWYNHRRPGFIGLPNPPVIRTGPTHHAAYGKVFDLGGKRLIRHLAHATTTVRKRGPRTIIYSGAKVTPYTAKRSCT